MTTTPNTNNPSTWSPPVPPRGSMGLPARIPAAERTLLALLFSNGPLRDTQVPCLAARDSLHVKGSVAWVSGYNNLTESGLDLALYLGLRKD